jgi:hypothetical protein
MSAARLQCLLALSDEELLQILDADPLSVITGEEDARPEVAIHLALLAEAEERVSPALLRRWLRTAGPAGRPIDRLLARDFAGFEDALAVLAERGYIIGGG